MQCVTTGYGEGIQGRAKDYPYYQAKLYEDYYTKTGKHVWKKVKTIGRAYRSETKAYIEAQEYAKYHNIPYLPYVKQWLNVEK